jgi:hypothetical protein
VYVVVLDLETVAGGGRDRGMVVGPCSMFSIFGESLMLVGPIAVA